MKKFVFVGIAVVVIVGTTIFLWHRSSHATDAHLSHAVTGFWPTDESGSGEHFNPDGSFLIIAHNRAGTNLLAGTWVINNGYLTETFTNMSGPGPYGRVGDTARLKIVSADAHHMTVEAGGHRWTVSRLTTSHKPASSQPIGKVEAASIETVALASIAAKYPNLDKSKLVLDAVSRQTPRSGNEFILVLYHLPSPALTNRYDTSEGKEAKITTKGFGVTMSLSRKVLTVSEFPRYEINKVDQ